MTKPTRPLTLQLSAEGHDKYLRLHFAGLLSDEMTAPLRRRFLRLASLLAWPEPLRVASFADESGNWAWAEEWTDALGGVKGGLDLRFRLREVRHGR